MSAKYKRTPLQNEEKESFPFAKIIKIDFNWRVFGKTRWCHSERRVFCFFILLTGHLRWVLSSSTSASSHSNKRRRENATLTCSSQRTLKRTRKTGQDKRSSHHVHRWPNHDTEWRRRQPKGKELVCKISAKTCWICIQRRASPTLPLPNQCHEKTRWSPHQHRTLKPVIPEAAVECRYSCTQKPQIGHALSTTQHPKH